jgi:hypothetical protein
MSASDLVNQYKDMSDNELFEALALELLGEGALGIGGHGLTRLRRYGREKWQDSQRLLVKRICTDEGKCRFNDAQVAIGQGLVAAISDALNFKEKESAMVAVLLMHYGLDKFCARTG